MTSQRVMRKSPRTASPLNNAVQKNVAPGASAESSNQDTSEEWVEPALRLPAPSFEDDNRGLERHGVLEQMAPLGTMPKQTVRLRIKPLEPPERRVSNKRASMNDAVISSAAGPAASGTIHAGEKRRRSDSHNVDDQHNKTTSLRERGEGEFAPKVTTRPTSSRSTVARPSSSGNRIPNYKTTEGREVLKVIVDSAFERSKEIGNELLGLAIRKLFDDSLHNKEIGETLNAVLRQEATPQQQSEFQTWIKHTRREIRNAQNNKTDAGSTSLTSSNIMAPNVPKTSASKSPIKRPQRSASRLTNSRAEKPSRNNTPSKRSQLNGRTSKTNGIEDDEPPTKKSKRSGSVSSQSSLSTTHTTDVDVDSDTNEPPSMRTRDPTGPKLHKFGGKNQKRMLAATSGANTPKAAQEAADDAELTKKKQKLTITFNDYEHRDSNIRGAPKPIARPQVKFHAPRNEPTVTTRGSNAHQDEFDDTLSQASSVQGDLLIPPPAGRASRSRGATPNALGRPKKEEVKKARTKFSPEKKKTGIVAGIARGGRSLRERDKDAEAALAAEDSDDSGKSPNTNNDYCDSCGGGGRLLMCDGCVRSFHLMCLDPPRSEEPEGDFLCIACEARQASKLGDSPRVGPGLFGSLLKNLKSTNPHAFSLPDSIRGYFDGVKVGEEGEYEEPGLYIKPKTSRGLGHDDAAKGKEHPNFRIKDDKGNVILCFKCGKSALGKREIISCDYCTLKWHLDCLDPPMANPPVRLPNDPSKARNSWMCPAHSVQELATTGRGGRMHKIRRPKHARVVDTMSRRGFKNRGLIEIENESSDEEITYDAEDNVIYRVSERSIKLDFIDRVYKDRAKDAQRKAAEEAVASEASRHEEIAAKEQEIAFNNRSFIEKDTALALLSFAQQAPVPGLDHDQIQPLINSLISNAPDHVVALITEEETSPATDLKVSGGSIPTDPTGARPMAPTPPISENQDRTLTDKQKQSYLLLLDLIQARLQEAEEAEAERKD